MGLIGERLLTINVLAGAEGIHDDPFVPVIRRGDDDGIDRAIGQQILVALVNLRAAVEALLGPGDPAFVGIDDAHDLIAGQRQQALHQLVGTRPGSDNSDLDFVIGGEGNSRPGHGGRGADGKKITTTHLHRELLYLGRL